MSNRHVLWLSFFYVIGLCASNEEVGWMLPAQFDKLPGSLPTQEPLAVPAPAALPAHSEALKPSLAAPGLLHPHDLLQPHAAEAAEHATGHDKMEAEAHHEEEPDAVTWTTALLLIGFLVIGVGMLYLVNCTDEDIRTAIWGMINTTVSIFCAATFDNAVFRFFHFQLVLSPPPRGFGLKHDTPWVKSCVGICFALIASFVLHVWLFIVPNDKHQTLFAIRTIGGHVYAFASILTFGFLQESRWFRGSLPTVLLVVLLAFIVMVVSYQFFLAAAKRCLSADQWQAGRVQRSQMKEMQLDASAIAIGFLLCQSICYYLSEAEDIHHRFIPILHGYPSEQKEHSVTVLCILAAVLLVLSAIWSIYLRPRKGAKFCGCCSNFVFNYIGVLLSCTGCWCLQRAGLLFLFRNFVGSENGLGAGMATNRANIVNAFVMSLLSVVCVLTIDKIADKVQKKTDPTSPKRSLVRDDGMKEKMTEKSYSQLETLTGLELDLPSLPHAASEMLGEDELSRLGEGLRTVMTGFGLLVGICWDKAFETAHETVAETVPAFNAHPVVGTFLVAAILLLFVVPAWSWYIVPNAMKDETQHAKDIELQIEQMTHSKGPQVEVSTSESGEGELESEG